MGPLQTGADAWVSCQPVATAGTVAIWALRDTPVVLDLLEFCAKAVGEPIQGSYHSYHHHYHLRWDRDAGLLAKVSVAIDGSKFKTVNSRDNNFTQGKIQRRQKQIEESVASYMSQLDTVDRRTAAGEEPSEAVLLTKTRLKEKLAKLEEEVKRLAAIEKALLASPDKQISLTDPDCRSMATSGRGSGMVAYNVQSAVDTTNHLIVAHEVTNVGTDRSQLARMAQAAKAALCSDNLNVVADRGYFKGEEILACDASFDEIDGEAGCRKFGLLLTSPGMMAKRSAQARLQFSHVKGLADEVVRPGVERGDAFGFVVAR